MEQILVRISNKAQKRQDNAMQLAVTKSSNILWSFSELRSPQFVNWNPDWKGNKPDVLKK